MQNQTTATPPTVDQLRQDIKNERARAEHWRATASTELQNNESLTRQVEALEQTLEVIRAGQLQHHAPADYYINHWRHGVIVIKHGEQGYQKTTTSEQEADALNKMQGHTRAQVQAAEACSMFNNWQNFASIVKHYPVDANQAGRLRA